MQDAGGHLLFRLQGESRRRKSSPRLLAVRVPVSWLKSALSPMPSTAKEVHRPQWHRPGRFLTLAASVTRGSTRMTISKQGIVRFPVLLGAAILGGAIGSAASLCAYTALKEADRQNEIIDEVKHLQLDIEKMKQLQEGLGELFQKKNDEQQWQARLSKQPTQRELNEAIEDLFDGLDDSASGAGKPKEVQLDQAQSESGADQTVGDGSAGGLRGEKDQQP